MQRQRGNHSRSEGGGRRPLNKDSAAYNAPLDPNRHKPVRPTQIDEAIFVTSRGGEEHGFDKLDKYERGGSTWIISGNVSPALESRINSMAEEGKVTIVQTSGSRFLHFPEDSTEIDQIKEIVNAPGSETKLTERRKRKQPDSTHSSLHD